MKTLFIDVDTQHDFCHPSGALFVRGADSLCERFVALTDRAIATRSVIVGSVDSHSFDAWEFAGATSAGPNGERPGFPPHCVKGTSGWLKVPGTVAPRARFVPNAPLSRDALEAAVRAHDPQQLLLEKEVYSLFANPNADAALTLLLGGERGRFVVYGVATDYCVKAAALGLVEYATRAGGGEIVLVTDAIAAVDPAATDRTIEELRARGVTLARTADIVSN